VNDGIVQCAPLVGMIEEEAMTAGIILGAGGDHPIDLIVFIRRLHPDQIMRLELEADPMVIVLKARISAAKGEQRKVKKAGKRICCKNSVQNII